MKRILSIALSFAVILSAMSFAGCSNGGGSSAGESGSDSVPESAPVTTPESTPDTAPESTPENTPETAAEIDYSQLSEEEIYDLMVERSLMTTGDMTRMANALKKLRDGEEITVAYIGGSITEGLTVAPAHPELCWANLSYEWLKENAGTDAPKINYVNAGMSGTPSILGNIRLERDVLAYEPDICFVEFAVNDGMSAEYQNSYESMVRTLLSYEKKDIAVVLLFTVIKSGHTCQPYMSQVGENYGLPMISEPDSLGVEFAEGRMTWEDYSDDESHPNEYGHTIVRDIVANYYQKVMEKLDENTGEVDRTLPAPVFSDRYQGMHYIDSEKLDVTQLSGFKEDDTHSGFHHGWSYKGDEGASMKFTLECRSLEIVYKANNSRVFGDADVYVDGEKKFTLSSNRSDGWNNPVTAFVLDEDETAAHEIEIVVQSGVKWRFEVLGFGYCD